MSSCALGAIDGHADASDEAEARAMSSCQPCICCSTEAVKCVLSMLGATTAEAFGVPNVAGIWSPRLAHELFQILVCRLDAAWHQGSLCACVVQCFLLVVQPRLMQGCAGCLVSVNNHVRHGMLSNDQEVFHAEAFCAEPPYPVSLSSCHNTHVLSLFV